MASQPNPDQQIDRSKQPPSLLRLFYRANAFPSTADFTTIPPAQALLSSSLQIYTWPDTTLRELSDLFIAALIESPVLPFPTAGTRLGFRLLFPDARSVNAGAGSHDEHRARWLSKELGSVVVGDDLQGVVGGGDGASVSGDAGKTLADARFVVGDYVSCAILPPRQDGSIAALPPSERSGGMGGGRDRGYGRDSYGRGGRGGYENGHGPGRGGRDGYGGRDNRRFGPDGDRFDTSTVPSGDWRRGERLPEGPGYGRGRGRGRYY